MTQAAEPLPESGAYTLPVGTLEDARGYIGRPVEVRFGAVAVNEAMSKQLLAAVHDDNPLYWDARLAESLHGSVVAPPATLVSWVTPLNWTPDGSGGPSAALLAAVPLPGDSMINIVSEMEFFDHLRMGDRLNVVEEVESVSDEKETKVGPGHFLTVKATFRRATGEIVALQRNTILRFSRREGED